MNDRERCYLQKGQTILLSTKRDGSNPERYEIQEVIGEGGSAVCYKALREQDGNVQIGKLKEFYPLNVMQGGAAWCCALERLQSGQLVPCSGTVDKFGEMCSAYLESYYMLRRQEAECDYNQILSNYIQDGQPLYGCPDAGDSRTPTVYVWSSGAEGKNFAQYLAAVRENPSASPDTSLHDIIRIVRTLTDCISTMHTAGLMHLDIKPSNFLIKYNSCMEIDPNQIVLFDINTMQNVNGKLSLYGGTPGYMAPELKRGKADNRSDIYSLGAMLFYALVISDKLPDELYQKDYYQHLHTLLLHSKLMRNADARYDAGLLSTLSKILRKCLAHEPSRRYPSCIPLLQDLERAELLAKQYDVSNALGMNKQYVLMDKTENGITDPVIVMQKLLYEHPLYEALKERTGKIRVLVIGAGNYSQKFVDTALQAAQMKDCQLCITVLSSMPEEDLKQYLEFRTELPRFVEIAPTRQDMEQAGDPQKYGKLCFCSLAEAADAQESTTFTFRKNEPEHNREIVRRIVTHSKDVYHYVFVSVGDEKQNKAIATLFSEQLTQYNSQCPVCYVTEKNKKPTRNEERSKQYPVCINEKITPETITPQLEQMAFNTHISWKDTLNLNMQKEYAAFCSNAYNYASSMAFVLSVKYKLHSIGIDGTSAELAEQFQQNVLDRRHTDAAAEQNYRTLVALEHRRWVLEKVTDGWRAPRDAHGNLSLQSCVRNRMVRNELECTHPCIAFSTEALPLSSELYQADGKKKWDDPEISETLDELDRISVMLYQCFAFEAKRIKDANPLQCEDIMALRNLLSEEDAEVKYAYKQFLFCLKNILNGVESYSKQYDRYANTLLDAVKSLPQDQQKEVGKRMELIKQTFFPVKEANLHRHYKLYDAVFIEKIPFILTYRMVSSMGCAFVDGHEHGGCNEDVFSDVASATVLCPQQLVYLYYFRKDSSLSLLKEKLEGILYYLQCRSMACQVSMAIVCPDTLSAEKRSTLAKQMQELPIETQIIDVGSQPDAEAAFLQYLARKKVQMFDGSNRVFGSLSEDTHFMQALQEQAISYFEFDWHHKHFCSCTEGTRFLQYITDTSYISVTDMFALMYARNTKLHFPEYSDDYETLWNIYTGNYLEDISFTNGVTNWNRLCDFLAKYETNHGTLCKFSYLESKKPKDQTLQSYLPEYTRKTLQKLLKSLKHHTLVDETSSVVSHTSDTCCLTVKTTEVCSAALKTLLKNPMLLQEYYAPQVVCIADEIFIRYRDMTVQDAPVGNNLLEARFSVNLLKQLEQAGYIRDLKVDENKNVSFLYATPGIKRLLTKAGEILEIYTYYEVLKQGYFDSVACGYEFNWKEKAVQNELDLVLTKGFSSIIVECKAVLKLEQDFYQKLDSLASHFGIGTTKVMVGNLYKDTFSSHNKIQLLRSEQMNIHTFHKQEDILHIGKKLRDLLEP